MKKHKFLCWEKMNQDDPVPECENVYRKHKQDREAQREIMDILMPWTLNPNGKGQKLGHGALLCAEVMMEYCRSYIYTETVCEYIDKLCETHSECWWTASVQCDLFLSHKRLFSCYHCTPSEWVNDMYLKTEPILAEAVNRGEVADQERFSYYLKMSRLLEYRTDELRGIVRENVCDSDVKEQIRKNKIGDPKDGPIFFMLPQSWESAKNDGERWRWLVHKAGSVSQEDTVWEDLILAVWLNCNYGTSSLYDDYYYGPDHGEYENAEEDEENEDEEDNDVDKYGPNGTLTAERIRRFTPELSDDESMAKFPNGVRRFKLPDDQNYLYRSRRVIEHGDDQNRYDMSMFLGYEYIRRHQLDKAAELFLNATEICWYHHWYNSYNYAMEVYRQITGNLGVFRPFHAVSVGAKKELRWAFRNGNEVRFTIHRINVAAFLDRYKYCIRQKESLFKKWQQKKVIPKKLWAGFEWSWDKMGKIILRNPKNRRLCLGEELKRWTVALEPADRHEEREITIPLDLDQPGAYLVEGKMTNGNIDRIIVWVHDVAFVQKNDFGRTYLFLVDAQTGEPVTNAKVHMAKYDHYCRCDTPPENDHYSHLEDYETKLTPWEERDFVTDHNGVIEFDERTSGPCCLSVVRGTKGEGSGNAGTVTSHFCDILRSTWKSWGLNETCWDERVCFMFDRPVYRPGDTIHFKIFAAYQTYSFQNENSAFAGKETRLEVRDSKNNICRQQTITFDRYGAYEGSFVTDSTMPLGALYFSLPYQNLHTQHRELTDVDKWCVQLEEYRNPEFEIEIVPGDISETPPRMIVDGKFKATVLLHYFFGEPVVGACLLYDIYGISEGNCAAPGDRWSFLYGRQHSSLVNARLAGEPEFHRARWQDLRPVVEMDENEEGEAHVTDQHGRFLIELDISEWLAENPGKAYTFQVNVLATDSSRKYISKKQTFAGGPVAFNLFCRPNRGFYEPGDEARIVFHLLTSEGKTVGAEGTVRVYQTAMDGNNDIMETEVFSTTLVAVPNRETVCSFVVENVGQYRVESKWVDSAGNEQKGEIILLVRGTLPGSESGENRLPLVPSRIFAIVPEKPRYKPGETARIAVFTRYPGMTVFLFTQKEPVYIQQEGQTRKEPQGKADVVWPRSAETIWEYEVLDEDIPNRYIDAFAVWNGHFYSDRIQLVIPPEEGILHVEVVPDKETCLPGESLTIHIHVTDSGHRPIQAEITAAIYDKSVEQLSTCANQLIEHYFHRYKHESTDLLFHTLEKKEYPIDTHRVKMSPYRKYYNEEWTEYGIESWSPHPLVRYCMGHCNEEEYDVSDEAKAEKEETALPDLDDRSDLRAPSQSDRITRYIRKNFADTALWVGTLRTDENGDATISCILPDALTTWRISVWAYTDAVRVGQAFGQVVAAKELTLRMQRPRFMVQNDVVILSANVHNYSSKEKRVAVSLLTALPESPEILFVNGENSVQNVVIPPAGEVRVDWETIAKEPGMAHIRMIAIADDDLDAVEQAFSILIHGIYKTEAVSDFIPADALRDDDAAFVSAKFNVVVPRESMPGQNGLTVRFSPSLALSAIDAIPWLLNYPYDCCEQTLHRFMPLALFAEFFGDSGIDPDKAGTTRSNVDSQYVPRDGETLLSDNPVFDKEQIREFIKNGITRLQEMQCSNGGWSWFGGSDHPSIYFTSLVVRGLAVVHDLKVLKLVGGVCFDSALDRGIRWLGEYVKGEVNKLKNGQSLSAKKKASRCDWKKSVDALDVMAYWALVEAGQLPAYESTNSDIGFWIQNSLLAMRRFLLEQKLRLSPYVTLLLALALCRENELRKVEPDSDSKHARVEENSEHIQTITNTFRQYTVEDDENKTARLVFKLGQNSRSCWFWYDDDMETHAAFLRLIVKTAPNDPLAPKLVKHILNNRRNAGYWHSTRDTAFCLEAIVDYLKTTCEAIRPTDVTVLVDGIVKKETTITPENILNMDNTLTLAGDEIDSGSHEIVIRQTGNGSLYYNSYLRYFSLEDPIGHEGLELKIIRSYWLLDREGKYHVLKDRQPVQSGDVILVKLTITCKSACEYIHVEDRKPAGFEPEESQSGYTHCGVWCYAEYRNDRVCFFIESLSRGQHILSYRLRAEQPGRFSSLPATIEAMYAPELAGNSDEFKVIVSNWKGE